MVLREPQEQGKMKEYDCVIKKMIWGMKTMFTE